MLNKCTLIGNVGADPEMRALPNGSNVATLSLATSMRYKDKATGERKELTEWHRIVFFNRLADVVGDYVKKGSKLYVEGRIQTRKWTDQAGVDRYSTEIIGGELHMLDGKPSGDGQAKKDEAYSSMPEAYQAPAQDYSHQTATPTGYDDFDSDNPFMSLNPLIKHHII